MRRRRERTERESTHACSKTENRLLEPIDQLLVHTRPISSVIPSTSLASPNSHSLDLSRSIHGSPLCSPGWYRRADELDMGHGQENWSAKAYVCRMRGVGMRNEIKE